MPAVAVSITLLSAVGAANALALAITPPPAFATPSPLQNRAPTEFSTCGYVDGDPSKPRIAPPGFNCRVDTANGLWGFCPTTVIAASDCGLGGFCFDAGPCSTGCGRESLRNNPKITAWRCPEIDDIRDAKFCTTESLIFGPDQTFDYVDCATSPGRQIVFFSPNAASSTKRPSSSPSSRPTLNTPSSTTELSSKTTNGNAPPPSTSASTNDTKQDGNPSISTGAVVGGSLGGLALLLVFGAAIVYLSRHNWSRRSLAGMKPTIHQDKASLDTSDVVPRPWEPPELAIEWSPGELAVPGHDPGIVGVHFFDLPAENLGRSR